MLRFWLGQERFREHILPASNEGLGLWTGRVPKECSAVWISPTNRPGAFHFQVFDIRPASFAEVAARAMRAPKRWFFAASAALVGLQDEAELNWRFALGSEPIGNYAAWLRARSLPRPEVPIPDRCDGGPSIGLFLDISDASASVIDETCGSVLGQNHLNWRVWFVGPATDPEAAASLRIWTQDPRFGQHLDGNAPEDIDFVLRLRGGDVLDESAFGCCAAYFKRHPEARLVYADELRRGEGESLSPRYKPGWSPTLQRSTRYIGRAAFFRSALLRDEPAWVEAEPEELVDRLAMRAAQKVGALRRTLFHVPAIAAQRPLPDLDAVYRGAQPSVSIVIPTRDKPELLEACLESLFGETTYRNYRVVLVDNDSVEQRTHALLGRMQAAEDRLTILRAPGDFNFSSLSNAGADAAPSDYLLFLNNDTRILTPNWIERLLHFAAQPDIGAVGAKLLYPNRRVQHVGVLLGMGGVAGHFGAGLEEGAPGWLQRNLVPHEVSAVTGACLMVERQKFEAVGRFDAANLPVDLNDVDLCLRLGERGWRTICNTQVVLIHHQSASRGGALRLQQVYEQERRFFVERWRRVIRDDPYFHPGLSLYADEESLP